MNRVIEALDYFHKVSGLKINEEKSHLYVAGVDEELKEKLRRISGFAQGTLPMKYLGVKLSPKKWSENDCQMIIDKITKRLNNWSTRLFTYAGRVVLINSILFSLHVYWAVIFILPKTVTDRVQQLYKDFFVGRNK